MKKKFTWYELSADALRRAHAQYRRNYEVDCDIAVDAVIKACDAFGLTLEAVLLAPSNSDATKVYACFADDEEGAMAIDRFHERASRELLLWWDVFSAERKVSAPPKELALAFCEWLVDLFHFRRIEYEKSMLGFTNWLMEYYPETRMFDKNGRYEIAE